MPDGGILLVIGAILVAAILIDWILVNRLRKGATQAAGAQKPGAPVLARNARLIPLLDFTFGSLLIYSGQSLVAHEGKNTYPISQWLNVTFHLGIDNLDNILLGLPLLWAGCFFIVRLLLRLRAFGDDKTPEVRPRNPLPIRILRSNSGWGVIGGALFIGLLLLLANKQYGWTAPVLWLLGLAIFASWAWKWDWRAGVRLSPNWTRTDLLWMVGLMLAGLLVATFRLQDVPNQMMGDEGTFWTTARDIATGKYQPPVFGLGVYTFGVLSTIVQGYVLKLFGISFWSWRFSSVLAGVAAIPPLYLLGRELFNRKVAVAACAAMFTAPYFLAFARLGYNNIQAVFVVTLSFYLFYLGTRRSSAFYLFLGGCTAGLGAYTYSAANGSIYVMGLFLISGLLYRPRRWRMLVKTGLIVAAGWFLVSIPFTVYASAFDPGALRLKPLESAFFNIGYGADLFGSQPAYLNAARFTIDKVTLFFAPDLWAIMLVRGTIRTLMAFNTPFLVTEHFIIEPLAGTTAVLFFMLGSIFALAKLKQKRFLFLLIWFGFNLLVFSIANTFPPRHQHLVGIIPLLAIFTGLGLVAFADLAAGLFPRLKGKAQGWLLGLLVLGVGASGLQNYFVTMPERYQPPFEQIVNWNALYAQYQPIYYLYGATERADFKPYVLREIRKDVPYQAIPIAEFVSNASKYPLPQNALIFYSTASPIAIEVLPALSAAYGTQSGERTFFNREGEPIGKQAWISNAPPDVLPESALLILIDSYARPVAWLLLALAILFLGLAVFRRAWLNRAPAWLTRALEGITRPRLEAERPLTDLFGPKPAPTLVEIQLAARHLVEHPAPPQAGATSIGAAKKGERPFIEVEFKLRVNLQRRQVEPRNPPAPLVETSAETAPESPVLPRPESWLTLLGRRAAQQFGAFVVQNPWLPAFLTLVALCLAAFGQIELLDHAGAEPGIWYLLLGGLVFTLASFGVTYAPQLPRPDPAFEYLFPSASLRIRLACASLFLALFNLFILQRRPTGEPLWDVFAIWIASVLLFLLAISPRPHFNRPRLDLKASWSTLLPLGLILLAGFGLRFYQLGLIPPIMENDEGKVAMQAVNVLNGSLVNMFRTWEGYGTLHFFLMSLPIRLLGQTILAVRLNTAILGFLTLPLIFLLARQMFGRRVALVSTALLAVSHLHFHFSRISPSAGSLDPLLATLAMLFIYRGVQSRRMIDWALAGVVMGLGMYFYVGARVLVFILAGFLILLLLFNRRLLWENGRNMWGLGGAFLVIAVPMLLWASLNPETFNARANQVGIIQNGWLANEMANTGTSAIEILRRQFASSFLIFNYHYPKWFYEAQVPALGPVTGVAFVLGLLAALPRLGDVRFALLSCWFWVTLIIGQVLVVDPTTNAYRTLGLIPAVCILAAVALVRLAEMLFGRWKKVGKVAPAVILSLVLLFEASWNAWNYFGVWAPENRYSDTNSRMASLIGEFLGEQPPDTQAYVVATEGFQAESWYSLNYLRRATPVEDLDRPLAEVILGLQLGARTLIIFPYGQEAELDAAQAGLPGGEVIRKTLGGELYFTAYIK